MKSLIDQTIGFANLEVILVNDASIDGTLQKLCTYEEQYPDNIMVINYAENRRQGYARNIGIQYSTAKYITFVDADDYISTDMLEKLYDKMEEGGYDYTICNYYRVINRKPIIMEEEILNKEIHYQIGTEEERKEFILTETPFMGSCGTFYRRDFILQNQIYYAEDMVYEDLLWLALIRFYATKVCIIPERLYYYVNWDNTSVVTKPNSTHHFDRLCVMQLFWQEAKSRGLYEKYPLEVEMHFLQMYYINSISFFAMRFFNCPLDMVLSMRDTVLREIPNYAENPYIERCFEFEQTILKLIEINPRSQEAWDSIFEAIRDGVTE